MENNVHILELATYEKPKVTEHATADWVGYGEDNMYYDWLIARYKNSTTNNAIINNVSRLIYGRGLHALDAAKKPNEYAMMKTMFSPDVLLGVALNFKMLGAGYFQIIYNKKHTKIVKVDYIPTRLIRPGKCNKDGIIDYVNSRSDSKSLYKNAKKHHETIASMKNSIDTINHKHFIDSLNLPYI